MKCKVCRTKEAKKGKITCSDKCNDIRLKIMKIANKYATAHGCDNCWGDLHIGCTDKCKKEFKKSRELTLELWGLYELIKS